MKRFSLENFNELAALLVQPYHENYFAMYSSIYGGIVTDPVLMSIPVDDHLVHRGDGVFETFKCIDGKIYNLAAHLERLENSSRAMDIELPWSADEIREITIETVRAAARNECIIRLLVSRGPGSLGVNPYDCTAPQLYIVVARLAKPFMTEHPDGASLITSSIPAKQAIFSRVKTCNYMANALMKKEAVDRDADFVAAFDDNGFLTEGATENIGIVSSDNKLLFPKPEGILRGTTMVRVTILAEKLVDEGVITGIEFTDITKDDMLSAPEILIVGTTRNVITVRQFDEKVVHEGEYGPVYLHLDRLLHDDMYNNEQMLTPVA